MRLFRKLIFKLLFPLLIFFFVVSSLIFVVQRNLKPTNPIAGFILNKPLEVTLAGTGSMYPTLYWDKKEDGPEDYETALKENAQRVKPSLYFHFYINLFADSKGIKLERPKIGFGDIVSFKKTNDSSGTEYIKRIIGLPNDKIEFRDGFVIRNGIKLHEPYTLKPRSTFGGSFIKECKEVTVPNDSFIALGDNRKISLDSRFEVQFVKVNEIDMDLPFSKQDKLKAKWRNIQNDEFEENKPTLDVTDFISKVNTIRKSAGLKPLGQNLSLNNSARSRANFALENNNFETKDRNGNSYFTLEMKKAGYDNILTGEYLLSGYYDSEELMLLRKESKALNEVLLNKDYQDIGISAVNKEVNGCPTQIIVLHFGGHIPATYDAKTVGSWRNAVDNLTKTSRDWKQARGNDLYDQGDLETLLKDFEKAINIAKSILTKMENQEWLSDKDNASIKEYEGLLKEINTLSEKLNKEASENSNRIKKQNYETCLKNWEEFVKLKEDCKKFLN